MLIKDWKFYPQIIAIFIKFDIIIRGVVEKTFILLIS